MNKKPYQWLPHLQDSIPQEAFGYTVSMYSVALEGWRRGLTLKFINNNRRKSEIDYSLTYNGVEKKFCVTMGEDVSKSAVRICRNKHLTKKYLLEKGVPTPEGELFGKESTDDELVTYANYLGYPLVLKPAKGTGGRGVIANIKNESEFQEALSFVKYDLGNTELIIEKFFQGKDYRVYVMQDKVLAVLDRISANVIGDGKKNIRGLLREKNKERVKNPAYHNRRIKIDKEMHQVLRQNGLTFDSVPRRGERVYLKSKNNISAGGDPIDITDEISKEIKDIAIQAVDAIPGLTHAGVDIIVDRHNNSGVILEINSRPSITGSLFPMEGKARNIPKEIIDHYFPETEANYDTPLYYFDFDSMYQSFLNGTAKEFTVPNIVSGPSQATRFIITGKFRRKSYEIWIRRQAKRLNLNGYAKRLEHNKIAIIVSGHVESVEEFRECINNTVPTNNIVEKISERKRVSPVKIGFEILESEAQQSKTVSPKPSHFPEGYHPVRLKDPKRRNKSNNSKEKTKKRSSKTTRQERDFYKKKYEHVINSTSWRVTKPLRRLGSLLKRNK